MKLSDLLMDPTIKQVMAKGSGEELLAAYEEVWKNKAILRAVYEDWYRRIFDNLVEGSIVEIGGGTGNLQRWLQEQGRTCWCSDYLTGKFIHLRADAHRLPFREGEVSNILLMDTLHHLAKPLTFFDEAAKALRPGGRLIMVEPYVSTWGHLVWKYLHHEKVDFQELNQGIEAKDAWDGNAAIPRWALDGRVPSSLKVEQLEYGEFLSYPLSGGFSYRPLLPSRLLFLIRRLEQSRLFRNRWVSLRIFAVLSKV